MLPKVKWPWPQNYRPEVDDPTELSSIQASYYQSLIGIIRWIVELGRADIVMETSALASMMALPREGHLDAVVHMFAFLKRKHNGVIVFDPTEPDFILINFPMKIGQPLLMGNVRKKSRLTLLSLEALPLPLDHLWIQTMLAT